MAYTPTIWVNDQAPALSAANLNKLTDELEAQAATHGIAHSLPTWADGTSPALTDANPLNEMERVTELLSTATGLSYTRTIWSTGWTPARSAMRLNKLEQQVAAISGAGVNYLDSFYDFYNSGGWGWLLNRWDTGTPATDPYSEPQETGTPWPAGGGMYEVTTPVGGGFKFVCTPRMTQGAGGKIVMVSDWNDHLGQMGSIEDWSFKAMFPSAGNPQGFLQTSNHVGLIWEWHETHSGTNISVAGERSPEEWKFAYHDESLVALYSDPNRWLVPVYTNVQVVFDQWYTWRVRKRDTLDNTGFLQIWLDGVQYLDLSNWRTLHTGPPWLQFGFYSHEDPNVTNEVHIAAITLAVS